MVKISAGEGIRTLEGLRQRILSPPPLTAWVPLQSREQLFLNLYLKDGFPQFFLRFDSLNLL